MEILEFSIVNILRYIKAKGYKKIETKGIYKTRENITLQKSSMLDNTK